MSNSFQKLEVFASEKEQLGSKLYQCSVRGLTYRVQMDFIYIMLAQVLCDAGKFC